MREIDTPRYAADRVIFGIGPTTNSRRRATKRLSPNSRRLLGSLKHPTPVREQQRTRPVI
jgi:hypothetical protein